MKRTENDNINTEAYWSHCYSDAIKRSIYEAQGTLERTTPFEGGFCVTDKTSRFTTALTHVKDGDAVLDIGCGVGVFTTMVERERTGCEIWGVDISKAVIDANSGKNPNIHYVVGSVGRLKGIPENHFDMVFSGETLEHLDQPETLFLDAYKSLKSGGQFVLTTPDKNAIVSPEHVWEFTHEDVESLYLENGFKDVDFVNLPNLEHLMVIFAVGVKR